MNEKHADFYNRVVRTLTWYEHPEENPFGDANVTEDMMYQLLVELQNYMDSGELEFPEDEE